MICWIKSVNPVADYFVSDKQNLFSTLNAFESKEITEVQNAHLKMLLKDGEKQTSRCKTFKCSKMRLEDPEAGWFLVAST